MEREILDLYLYSNEISMVIMKINKMKDMIFIDTYKKIQKHDQHHVTIPDYVYIEIFFIYYMSAKMQYTV